MRFSEIRRGTTGLSTKMLAGLLQQLERDGGVEWRYFAVIPPRADYELTEFGDCLAGASALLSGITKSSRDEVERSRRGFDAKNQNPKRPIRPSDERKELNMLLQLPANAIPRCSTTANIVLRNASAPARVVAGSV